MWYKKSMIDAVIFDMDGLLVDSEPVWDRARLDMAARLGKTWDKEDHHAIMGTNTQAWVDYMIRALGSGSSAGGGRGRNRGPHGHHVRA